MKNFITDVWQNRKTTAAGLVLIFGALADLALQVKTGMYDGNRLQGDVTAIVSGFGLLVAGDASNSKTKG